MAESEKNKVTMELNSHQLETIKSLFGYYNWDINIEAESFVSEMVGTHRTSVHKQKVWRLKQKMKILDL